MYRLSLLLLLFSSLVQAQSPTIELSDVFLGIGGQATWQQCENADNGGPAGENVTWDFTDLDTIDNQVLWSAIDPSATPFWDSFPTANLVYYIPPESILTENAETYQYYRFDLDENTVELLGFVVPFTIDQDTIILEDTLYTIYDDPATQSELPMTFGTTFTDTFSYRSVIAVENPMLDTALTFTTEVTGVTTSEVDGYGTLMTPAATYQDAIRQKTTTIRTTRVLGLPAPPTVMRADGYSWFAAGTEFTLMSIDSQLVAPPGIPFPTPDQLRLQLATFYLTDVTPSAVPTVSADQLGFSAYPNPARERLTAEFQLTTGGDAKLQLYGPYGRLLRTVAVTRYPAGGHQRVLGLTNLPPGIYSLVLETPDGRAALRIILQ